MKSRPTADKCKPLQLGPASLIDDNGWGDSGSSAQFVLAHDQDAGTGRASTLANPAEGDAASSPDAVPSRQLAGNALPGAAAPTAGQGTDRSHKGWVYHQSTGELTYNGEHVASGHSGKDEGKNNPGMEGGEGVGPIPHGRYDIGPQHISRNVGPVTMNLQPLPGTDTHGRSLFRIHGDNKAAPGKGSEGCVVLPLHVRNAIARSPNHVLTMVP